MKYEDIVVLLIVIGGLFLVLLILYFAIFRPIQIETREEGKLYQNSLFRHLKRIALTKSDMTDPVLEAYNNIKYKIYKIKTNIEWII